MSSSEESDHEWPHTNDVAAGSRGDGEADRRYDRALRYEAGIRDYVEETRADYEDAVEERKATDPDGMLALMASLKRKVKRLDRRMGKMTAAAFNYWNTKETNLVPLFNQCPPLSPEEYLFLEECLLEYRVADHVAVNQLYRGRVALTYGMEKKKYNELYGVYRSLFMKVEEVSARAEKLACLVTSFRCLEHERIAVPPFSRYNYDFLEYAAERLGLKQEEAE
jgi:hypothetical protein